MTDDRVYEMDYDAELCRCGHRRREHMAGCWSMDCDCAGFVTASRPIDVAVRCRICDGAHWAHDCTRCPSCLHARHAGPCQTPSEHGCGCTWRTP